MLKKTKSKISGIKSDFVYNKVFPFLVIFVFLATSVIITTLVIKAYRASSRIYLSLIRLESDGIEKKTVYFFKPAVASLSIIKEWGEEGTINLNDVKSLNSRFIPMLTQYQSVSSMMIADSNGMQYILKRDDDTWMSCLFNTKAKGKDINWKRWSGSRVLMEEISQAPSENIILGNWYDEGLKTRMEGNIYWTQPFICPLDNKLTISGALGWQEKDNPKKHAVVAFNIPVSEIVSFTLGNSINSNIKVFLVTEKDIIVDLSKSKTSKEIKPINVDLLKTGTDDMMIKSAVKRWKEENKATFETIRFESNGKVWFCEFRPLENGMESFWGKDTFWMCVAMPEDYIMASVRTESLTLILISVGVLAFGVLLIVVIIRKYRSRISKLEEEKTKHKTMPESENDVISLIKDGESTYLEFKSSLRWDFANSRSNSKLEEVIMKSIAAFNNGDGGILMIGVKDDGEILGLEYDYDVMRERGKDCFELHLRNLINAEYGIEYATNYLSVNFPRVNGKEICIVEVKRGEKPLFTTVSDKNGQKSEKFYVRSGNSSREVSKPSEITDYINKRFNKNA